MEKPTHDNPYNEQLFSGGFRARLHFARFRWVAEQIRRLGCPADSVLEIGCYDAKLLSFLKRLPTRYAGFDANWGNGLDLARERWANLPGASFVEVESPEAMGLRPEEIFDVAVSMETLEHLTPEMVDGYLRVMAAHLNGYLFLTVPNEKGLFFLAKHCTKTLLGLKTESYSPGEIMNATLGRLHRIDRTKSLGDHKGFDYHQFIKEVGTYFDVLRVDGIPIGVLPVRLNYGVAILAKSRPRPSAG